jgi:Zn-finger nucleic acid-binding protein
MTRPAAGGLERDCLMDCPDCNSAMVTLELSDVEIDHCVDCGGIWLDAGELELLVNNAETAKQIINSFEVQKNVTEKFIDCPICDRRMEKILVGQDRQPLVIDRCRKGHGLWFDKGELEKIFDKAHLDRENKIKGILADMFGRQ